MDDFHHNLIGELSNLRAFARFLTRTPSTADDLVQDTITRALNAREQYNTDASMKSWLFTIQRNIFYEQYRRRSKEKEIMESLTQDQVHLQKNDHSHSGEDDINDLSSMLWQLPEILREAIILVGAQELTYEEAAEICCIPLGTMKARVSRARNQLNDLRNASLVAAQK
ncbi:sigma-70 family RNA polymerase sigma factor [Neokomagataea tanensis]|uniref:Sigma-70 family RNA polymerase sigma factor n=2 Tax=Neokomagataea TaxID=1223423 RepID=A0A4Y6VAQ6_9PROT|nr:sigma-70 family RNA polymerase sigma factor [Neokomagataea tanensis]